MPADGAIEIVNGPVALRRACFVVAYDGSGFHGFAPNRDVKTVVGVLTEAMSLVSRHSVHLVGAGRTDAGVHAWGQVISCDLPAETLLGDLIRRVNRLCSPRVVLRSGEWVSDDFSARFNAKWRHYRYTVHSGTVPNPFLASTAWHVRRPLLLPAMQLACDPLIGEHDFSSFCRRPHVGDGEPEPSMRRRVVFASWTDVTDVTEAAGPYVGDARVLRFDIRANAFCHQMVRSIVGTLVDVGRGRFHAGDIRALMQARNRQGVSEVAPAHGLVLWEVGYSDDLFRRR